MQTIILSFALLFSINSFAASQYVYNVTKHEVVIDNGSELIRPIASVTKLMTALVVVDSKLNMDEKVPYKGSKTLSPKNRSRDELFHLMLVKSDNNAAEALARSYPGGREGFITAMNIKARELGMFFTTYEDPSGLGVRNQSTARELSLLLNKVYNYPKIRQVASTTSFHVVDSYSKKKKKKTVSGTRVVTVNNTNFRLLNQYHGIEVSKTGYTNPAGKCLVMFLTKNDEQYTFVVLGEKNMRDVEVKARKIIDSL